LNPVLDNISIYVPKWYKSTSTLYTVVFIVYIQMLIISGSTGAAGPRLFTIHLVDTNTDNLPKAHTW
jgi:cadmium resistance protein CadD (predicted permease)